MGTYDHVIYLGPINTHDIDDIAGRLRAASSTRQFDRLVIELRLECCLNMGCDIDRLGEILLNNLKKISIGLEWIRTMAALNTDHCLKERC